MNNEVLGVDIGSVIISKTWNNGFCPPLKNAFSVLKRLKNERFGDKVFVVSQQQFFMDKIVLLWLWYHNFYKATGIRVKDIYFCRKRIDKAAICKNLGITHFIDDRTEVLTYLHDVQIKNLYLFRPKGKYVETKIDTDILPFVKQVASWKEIEKEFLE